jgi:serine/threonine protein kinase
MSILAEKAHPRIVRIVELIEDDENYYIVSEVLKGGELFKRIIEAKCFTEQQASIIVKQIMEGLNYMHQQMVTHRDLKPENILLVSDDPYDLSIRIADLGFAQKFEKDKSMNLVLGTPLYMSPELIRRQQYNEKVDVWSLGVIVYQLLCGMTPFDAPSLKRIQENICNLPDDQLFQDVCWNSISDDAKDFIL